MDQDSVLYLLACTSLVVYSLQATYGKDLDEQVLVRLEDYHLLENIGLKTTLESYCGSGYSSDSSDCNTEGTAGYTSDSASGESSYATDSNESSTGTLPSHPPHPPFILSLTLSISLILFLYLTIHNRISTRKPSAPTCQKECSSWEVSNQLESPSWNAEFGEASPFQTPHTTRHEAVIQTAFDV